MATCLGSVLIGGASMKRPLTIMLVVSGLVAWGASQALPGTAAPLTQCVGDCDGDSSVTVNEVLTCVEIALGEQSLEVCPACRLCPLCDNPEPSVSDLLLAVNNALYGCPQLRPTPTPAPAAIIHYQLTAGSGITFGGAASREELLSGEFDVVPTQPSQGNTVYRLSFTNVDLHSVTFGVTDGVGDIQGVVPAAGPGPEIMVAVSVSINGQSVELTGEGPPSTASNTYPPAFRDLQICGAPGQTVTCDAINNGTAAGYALTIFAQPGS